MKINVQQVRGMSSRKRQALVTTVLATAAIGTFAIADPGPKVVNGAPLATKVQNQFFDWTVGATAAPPSNYIPSPHLTDANAASVNAFLTGLPVGSIRSVTVERTISNATANLIFNNPAYNVSYVFGDLEGGAAIDDALMLTSQVKSLEKKVINNSANAYVGNFGFWDLQGKDPTQPNGYAKGFKGKHSFSGWTHQDWIRTGLTMENAELYPGSPSFRNPASGDSTAPNIRSALFTLPVWRLSQVTASSTAGQNIPWVADFNNWGNNALDNDPGNGYLFTNPTGNQMLSGKDFATLIAHYRLRGADSFSLLETGVVGKTQTQMQDEARTGWLEPHINARLSAVDATLMIKDGPSGAGVPSLGTNTSIVVDDSSKTIEVAGAVWSGVYSISQGKLDILISNMDEAQHKITLPSSAGGFSLAMRDFTLLGGTHQLVEYTLADGKWTNAVTSVPFSSLDDDRSRPGVPEPGMLSIMALGGGFFLTRRRRKVADVAEAIAS